MTTEVYDEAQSLADVCFDVADIELTISSRRCLSGHSSKIYQSNFSKYDKNKIISVSQDGSMIIWDCFRAMKMYVIPSKSCWIMCSAFSDDDSFIVSGGLDNIVTIYKYDHIQDLYEVTSELNKHQGYISQTEFIGDDKILSSSGDGTCIMWDLVKEYPALHFKGHSFDVNSFSFSTELNSFITSSLDTTVKLWDYRIGSPQLTFETHKDDVNCARFLSNGIVFGTASDDMTLGLLDVRNTKPIASYSANNFSFTSVESSISGRLLFGGSTDSNIYIFDTLKQKLIGMLSGHTDRISGLRVSPSGNILTSVSWDSFIKIWN